MAKKRPAKKTSRAARSKTTRRKTTPRVRAKAAKAAPRKRTKAVPRQRTAAAKSVRPTSPRPAAATNPLNELAQRIIDLTVRGDDEASFALYADNVESIEPGMPPAVGMDAIKQKFAMWRGMVSDSTWEARNLWVGGNTIAVEWAGRVTFAATGKQADFNEVAVHEIENGKIVRERFYYDRAALQG